jgi:hypothetical protein
MLPRWQTHGARDIRRLLDKCLDNAALARAQPQELAANLLNLRAAALARAGRSAEALQAANELLALPNSPNSTEFAARASALAAASAADSRPELGAEAVKTAICALRQGIHYSVVDVPELPFDPVFAALRANADFIALTRRPWGQSNPPNQNSVQSGNNPVTISPRPGNNK